MAGLQNADMRVRIEVQDGDASDEIAGFLEREWEAYHREQGHDPGVTWVQSPLLVTARDDAGRLIGVARGRVRAGVGHLSELMVARDARGRGVGGRLLAAFEERCRRAGCHKLTIHTDYDGPAHQFYRRRGWRDEAVFQRDRGGRDFVRLCKFTDE